MPNTFECLKSEISACVQCTDRFAATATAHKPRPIVWLENDARILIVGQAPGLRVHKSGRPFSDPSGDRLRDWLGISEDGFYDRNRVAILPMAFCFPGYDAKGADLPPPPICINSWHGKVVQHFSKVSLTVLVGGYAHKWHLNSKMNVTQTVLSWSDHAPKVFPLPHPSWRNSGWLKVDPWFEEKLLPDLRKRVKEVLDG
ncbi:MAG: uracil-DNA glycosylase family protein [Paracoccaceae bacterium]